MYATIYKSERGQELLQKYAHLENAVELVAGLIGQSADVTLGAVDNFVNRKDGLWGIPFCGNPL
ncbi:MAG TPA: hypothetical protein VE999_04185 [Gemmataceae bacterium]|nr:hypothetical protein [Gemmataceae bacterium]